MEFRPKLPSIALEGKGGAFEFEFFPLLGSEIRKDFNLFPFDFNYSSYIEEIVIYFIFYIFSSEISNCLRVKGF